MAAFVLGACVSNEPELGSPAGEVAEMPVSEPQGVFSALRTADPRAGVQLLSGFYGIEQGAWRWTAREFSVALKPPPAAPDPSIRLTLEMGIPEVVIDRLQSLALAASANGVPLGSETYDRTGKHVFSKPVPEEVLGDDVVEVEFTLDKALSPGEIDQRELGVIVISIALQ